MTEPAILTAAATYGSDQPSEGLPELFAEAQVLGARVQIDTDPGRRQVHVLLTVESKDQTESPHALSRELALLSAALPPGASERKSSWRTIEPLPF